jgi:hypothetical protein
MTKQIIAVVGGTGAQGGRVVAWARVNLPR